MIYGQTKLMKRNKINEFKKGGFNMSQSILIYNQPEQKFLNIPLDDQDLTQVDLSKIDLPSCLDISYLINSECFALVFDGENWNDKTYMQWEDLRINEALNVVNTQFSQSTQDILIHFVAGMDVKYQGDRSWIELLGELGKEIEDNNP